MLQYYRELYEYNTALEKHRDGYYIFLINDCTKKKKLKINTVTRVFSRKFLIIYPLMYRR